MSDLLTTLTGGAPPAQTPAAAPPSAPAGYDQGAPQVQAPAGAYTPPAAQAPAGVTPGQMLTNPTQAQAQHAQATQAGGFVSGLISSSTPGDGGLYFAVDSQTGTGQYPVCELLSLSTKQSRKNRHIVFIAEFLVLESKVDIRPPGTQVGWVRDLQGNYPEANAAECRELIAALFGPEASWEQVDDDTVNKVLSPAQPLTGRLVLAEAFKKKPDKDFVSVRFSGIPGSLDQHKQVSQQLRQKHGLPPF